jgi:ubiquinone/menaquinone biosynthesis C-methylase UbiE
MLFDDWPVRYEEWFSTPIGNLVMKFESRLVLELVQPDRNDQILDAGCGTGVFTSDFLDSGSSVVGLDLSLPMLVTARRKMAGRPFSPVQGDMLSLPFGNNTFTTTVSITALEFISDARKALDELFRVTAPGGTVVVATLNSLSPWADRRRAKTFLGQKHVLENAYYRSGQELLALGPSKGLARTAIHFQKGDSLQRASEIELKGQSDCLDSGAFVAVRWQKPVQNS